MSSAPSPIATARAGYTLLEVLLACFLLLGVVLAMASTYSRGRAQIDLEEDRRKATAVVQAQLDAVRRDRTYDSLPSLADTTYQVDGRTYTVTHVVTLDSPGPMVATVAVQVSWNARLPGGGQLNRSLSATTMLARSLTLGGTP